MFCWAITFEELLMPKELKINEEAIEACKKCLLEIIAKYTPNKKPQNLAIREFWGNLFLDAIVCLE